MLRAFHDRIRLDGLIHPRQSVVVGVSGGADSMALLTLLDSLRKDDDWGLKLVVAHLDHALRGAESDADAEFVRQAARGLGFKCVVERRDIPTLAAAQKKGIEETSRHERYAFFERVCLQVGASVVALAHHADDQAETILLRILRGTGFRGLAGMPSSRPLSPGSAIRLVRPLLGVTRREIREYLATQGIAFREDHTNLDPSLLRNRIRHQVLPLLEQQVNAQVRTALQRLAEQARWFDEYFDETVTRTLETLVVSRDEQQIVLNATALARKSRLLQTGLIRTAFSLFGVGEVDLSFTHLLSVAELLDDPASGKKIELPGGIVAEKRYEQLIFTGPMRPGEVARIEEAMLTVPGRLVVPGRKLEIRCQMTPDPGDFFALCNQGGPMSERIDFDAVQPPLRVRSPHPGERFFPLGAPGTKKLADFLADAKTMPNDRRQIVLVCDQAGPVWVVGHRIDDRVKLTPHTRRVLHLEAKEYSS